MIGATVVGIPALIGGWYLVRGRVDAAAQDVGPSAGHVLSRLWWIWRIDGPTDWLHHARPTARR